LDPPSSGACGVVQTAGVVLLSFASIGNAARRNPAQRDLPGGGAVGQFGAC